MSLKTLYQTALLIIGVILFINLNLAKAAWGGSDKIKLTDVKAVTLYRNKMTTGRRSSPVPQLQCVGGSAGCSAFVPEVVQCYNRGSNGYDVQWECKTDMDNAFRFGKIEVVCEGYDYPNDPYVLKGSCGLEYTIDFTQAGYQKKGQQNSYKRTSDYSTYGNGDKPSKTGHIIILVAVGILIYALYKTCLQTHQYSSTNSDYNNGDDRQGGGFFSNIFGGGRNPGYGSSPPPPGFRPEYYGTSGCAGTNGSSFGRGGGSTGFWTGAMTGGLLGYMFGRNNQDTYGYARPSGYRERTTESSWGATSSGDDYSSGTRTASGFGETRRR